VPGALALVTACAPALPVVAVRAVTVVDGCGVHRLVLVHPPGVHLSIVSAMRHYVQMSSTPLWIPLVVAGMTLLGTVSGGVVGVVLTQRRADRREQQAWEREREREKEHWGREDAARTFEHRREAYVNFYTSVTVLAHKAFETSTGGGEPLEEGWNQEALQNLQRLEFYADHELCTTAQEAYQALSPTCMKSSLRPRGRHRRATSRAGHARPARRRESGTLQHLRRRRPRSGRPVGRGRRRTGGDSMTSDRTAAAIEARGRAAEHKLQQVRDAIASLKRRKAPEKSCRACSVSAAAIMLAGIDARSRRERNRSAKSASGKSCRWLNRTGLSIRKTGQQVRCSKD
jgi:hypothetical protein